MTASTAIRPWPALWSLVLGFFMILVDTTIVSVANPTIMQSLGTNINTTLWATSAYLLAYAVPLLITGRLGDRFGPRRIYLIGLIVFTLSSLACGLSGTIEALIIARVFQGFGAAMMTPQTMAVITRIFAPQQRGAAMALWGATAGVATLVGPILGGILIDSLGWEWIFFINVPVGIIAFALALRNVPALQTHPHRFDLIGVALSAAGMFMIVFGIQEGESYNWGQIWGPVSVWGLIVSGIIVMVLFVIWQRVQRGEPLLPLKVFRDRNFAVGNLAISTVGFSVTGMALPLIFYAQTVRGLTPTQSALLMAPMAVLSGVLAPFVGKLIDRGDPRWIAPVGLVLMALGLGSYSLVMTPDSPIWLLLVPSVILGFANAGMWGPLASITTYNLSPALAGAGSGVYNTTRQVGAVLGSAAMALMMQARIAAEMPAGGAGGSGGGAGSGAGGAGSADSSFGLLPESLHAGFSAAMAQSLLLPAAVVLLGAAIALFFARRGKARDDIERTVPAK